MMNEWLIMSNPNDKYFKCHKNKMHWIFLYEDFFDDTMALRKYLWDKVLHKTRSHT